LLSIWEKLQDQDEARELLERLKVSELKELAKRNNIPLEKRDFLGRLKPAKTKDEIINVLINSEFNELDLIEMLGLSRLTNEELLNCMTVKELRGLAREYGVALEKSSLFGTKKATRKDDIIEVLKTLPPSKIRGYSEKISLLEKLIGKELEEKEAGKRETKRKIKVEEETIKEKITEREIKRRVMEYEEVTVESIIEKIEEYRPPPVRGRRIEEKLTIGLTSFLQSSFPDIELEQPIARGARIDAIVGGKIGIEAKYRPQATEMDRLYGQIEKYLRRLDHVIVVFFETPTRDVRNFQNRIKKIFANRVTVLNVV